MTTRRVTERDLDSMAAEAQRPSKAKADVEQWRRQHFAEADSRWMENCEGLPEMAVAEPDDLPTLSWRTRLRLWWTRALASI